MGKRYTFDGDANSDPKRRPMPVNGDGDTSEHTEPIDGAAIPRDLDHDLPSVAAIIAEATAEVEALTTGPPRRAPSGSRRRYSNA